MGYLVPRGTLVNVWGRNVYHSEVVVLEGSDAEKHSAETRGPARYSTVLRAESNRAVSIPNVNSSEAQNHCSK